MYQKVIDKIQQDRIFTPELLNRFDEMIVFHPLNQNELVQVADLALKDLKKRLAGKDILISYADPFLQQLAKVGYDPVFGARELRRVVEKEIEDEIAKDLLSGKITKGKEFELPIEYLN
jgi:ATP-dependent Clp protease ATP-binding subunit ClpA